MNRTTDENKELTTVTLDTVTGAGMSDMSEVHFMRLQTVMDNRSKFFQTLSNVMKKIDDTSDPIIQNIR
jgi:hypothetical protein